MNRYKKQGWFGESYRHYLASKYGSAFARKRPGLQGRTRNVPIVADKLPSTHVYPIDPESVRKVLDEADDTTLKGLKQVRFTTPRDKHQKNAWAQYVRSNREIRIFAQPSSGGLVDGQNPLQVRKLMREYVLPHELGHHKALEVEKITDKDLSMAEARADAHVAGLDPHDKAVKLFKKPLPKNNNL